MPLSAKARIEVYLPDLAKPVYQNLQEQLTEEFCYTWGGCSLIRGIMGFYLSNKGKVVRDQVNLLYSDTKLNLEEHWDTLTMYGDSVRTIAMQSLQEEAVLVVIFSVHHSQ